MRRLGSCLLALALAAPTLAERPGLLLVLGAPGAAEFEDGFGRAAARLAEAAARAGPGALTVTDRDALRDAIREIDAARDEPFWIVYIGHGSWDGREARLNLIGPDVTASELAEWLDAIARPLVFVHGGAASAPFVPALSRAGRVIVTATETGDEVNYARFGEAFAAALADDAADLDQDGRTSVLEAFLHADRRVQAHYAEAGRLATEHAILDDNGDGRGTPAAWFDGTRASRRSDDGAAVDGALARRIALIEPPGGRALTAWQRGERDRLEEELERLRERADRLAPEEHLLELERILRRLTPLYVPVRDDS